jgi:putative membrane protein
LELVSNSFNELPWFLAYMATAMALTLSYVVIYMWVTPHPEIKLILENNLAASLAFAGSLIGFCLPLASAMANSLSLVDCAFFVQIAIFYLVRLPIPRISERIEKNELASGFWLGATSFAGGILNAAAMTN